jgi:hypothetical protein
MTKHELMIALTVPRAYFIYGLALHRTSAAHPALLLEYLGSGRPMVFMGAGNVRAEVSLRPLHERYREKNGPMEFQSALGVALRWDDRLYGRRTR